MITKLFGRNTLQSGINTLSQLGCLCQIKLMMNLMTMMFSHDTESERSSLSL